MTTVTTPTDAELQGVLGDAAPRWAAIVSAMEREFTPLDRVWKPSKLAFGRMCLLQHKKRTLLYLIPQRGEVLVAVVLGERAYGLAMASSIPAAIKELLSEARPYVEGRGIRFPVRSARDVTTVTRLVELKTAPKTR
jgi:hypothetical protein